MKMRQLSFSIFVVLFTINCNAQSFFGVTSGVDFALISESINSLGHKLWLVDEDGYSVESLVLGIKGEHQLSNSFSLVLHLSYTRKNVKAHDLSFDPFEGLKFNYFRNSISGHWYLKRNWFIGTGLSFNYISNINSYFGNGVEEPFSYIRQNKKEYGGLLSTGLRYNNFLIDLYFNKSFTPPRKDLDDFKPINSFGISLSYLIRVGKNKGR